MARESLRDLVWKMEGKGFDWAEIHFYISVIWDIPLAPVLEYENSYVGMRQDSEYEKRLMNAHVEIDFTGYKK